MLLRVVVGVVIFQGRDGTQEGKAFFSKLGGGEETQIFGRWAEGHRGSAGLGAIIGKTLFLEQGTEWSWGWRRWPRF